jgi:hypothetical protein
MPLSFLIVDTYYSSFLEAFHAARPELDGADYETTLQGLMAGCFGTSDFYSTNLRSLGHQATDLVVNDRRLQAKWATENGFRVRDLSPVQKVLKRVPYARRYVPEDPWLFSILEAQIKATRPDVVYFLDLNLCEPAFLDRIRPFVKLVVGQIACPLPDSRLLHGCDLILTSFPHYVDRFREMGVESEYFRIGFESTLLDRVKRTSQTYDAVFVGGFMDVHSQGTAMLERVAQEVGLDVWGYGTENLASSSPLRANHHGEAWGLQMYDIFCNSRIVLNRHSAASENYANNMRLYEATGVGALLVTDMRDNLGDLFKVGTEVVAYESADDLIEKVRYYLSHEEERAKIARAGQQRTLAEHTYGSRMQELERIVEAYIGDPTRTGKATGSRSGS